MYNRDLLGRFRSFSRGLVLCILLVGSLSCGAYGEGWKPRWFHSLQVISNVDLATIEKEAKTELQHIHWAEIKAPKGRLTITITHDITPQSNGEAGEEIDKMILKMRERNPAMIQFVGSLEVPGASSSARRDIVSVGEDKKTYRTFLICKLEKERWVIDIISDDERNGQFMAKAFADYMRVDKTK